MNWDVAAVVFNFSVVVICLWHFGRKPFADFLAARQQTVKKEMEEAQEKSAQAQRHLSAWQSRWNALDPEIAEEKKGAEGAAHRFRETALSQARAEAERIREESVLAVESERLRSRQRLQRELADQSIAIARETLSTKLEAKERHRLITENLETFRNGNAG